MAQKLIDVQPVGDDNGTILAWVASFEGLSGQGNTEPEALTALQLAVDAQVLDLQTQAQTLAAAYAVAGQRVWAFKIVPSPPPPPPPAPPVP